MSLTACTLIKTDNNIGLIFFWERLKEYELGMAILPLIRQNDRTNIRNYLKPLLCFPVHVFYFQTAIPIRHNVLVKSASPPKPPIHTRQL